MVSFVAFRYSRVFCPIKQEIVFMNEFDKEKISVNNAFEFHAVNIAEKVKGNFDFLGKKYPKDIAKKISSCLLHPVSL